MAEKEDVSTTIINRRRGDLPRTGLPPGIRASLKFIDGPEKGRMEYLEKPINALGRHRDNDVKLGDNAASSHHAVVFFAQSMEWRIEDVGSTNGTLLNGAQVSQYALRDGDKIVIGDNLMVFNVERT